MRCARSPDAVLIRAVRAFLLWTPTPEAHMKLLISTALLLAASAAAGQQPQPAFGCSAPVARQFDFWVGRWEVRDTAGNVLGHNTIEVVEGGCVLQENWRGARGSTGRSLNFVENGEWHQVWVANNPNSTLRLQGGLHDGAMVMRGTTVNAQGASVHNRITWTPLPNGDVRQLWETSTDGSTWRTLFDGRYVTTR
jgi:hypothetical protein